MTFFQQRLFKQLPSELQLNILSYMPNETILSLEQIEKTFFKLNLPAYFWVNRLKEHYDISAVQDEDSYKKFLTVYLYKSAESLIKHPLEEFREMAQTYFKWVKSLLESLRDKNTADAGWLDLLKAEMYCKKYTPEPKLFMGKNMLHKLIHQNESIAAKASYLLALIHDRGNPWEILFASDINFVTYSSLAARKGHPDGQALFGQMLIEPEFMHHVKMQADPTQGWDYLFQALHKKSIIATHCISDALTNQIFTADEIKDRLSQSQQRRLAEIRQNFHFQLVDALKFLLLELALQSGEKTVSSYFINIFADKETLELFQKYQILGNNTLNELDTDHILPDPEQLLKYLRLGLSAGDALSAECLALLYLNQNSLSYDPQEALTTIKKGQSLGSATCFAIMGYFYLLGREEVGIKPDLAKASSYLEQAVAIDRRYFGRTAEFYANVGSDLDFLNWAVQGLAERDSLSCRYLFWYVAKLLLKDWKISGPDEVNIELSLQLNDLDFGGIARISSEELQNLVDRVCDFCGCPRLSSNTLTPSMRIS